MAYSYDRRVAAVTLKELPQGGYQLIGDYQDMRDIIPTLKRQKWWYDGSTRSWSMS